MADAGSKSWLKGNTHTTNLNFILTNIIQENL